MIDIRNLQFQSNEMYKPTMRPTSSGRVFFFLFWPAQILMSGPHVKVMHPPYKISPSYNLAEFKLINWKWKWLHVFNLTWLNKYKEKLYLSIYISQIAYFKRVDEFFFYVSNKLVNCDYWHFFVLSILINKMHFFDIINYRFLIYFSSRLSYIWLCVLPQ